MKDKFPTLGRVTTVVVEDGIVRVSVQDDRPASQRELVPFMSMTPGSVLTPQEGDLVELYRMSGGGMAARFAHSTPRFPMPEMGENEMIFRFDENTEIRFYKDDTDQYVARLAGDVRVEVESQTDVDVLAGGSISLGTGGSQLVTDVTTTKDADGHVTGISLTKTTKTNAE